MGTSAVVGTFINGEVRGRVVHSDGYPGWMGWQLANLIRRDGMAQVLTTIGAYAIWSEVDVEPNDLHVHSGCEVVPGYGIAHINGRDRCVSAADWAVFDLAGNGDAWGSAWAYGITEHGTLVIIKVNWRDDTGKVVAEIPLSELATERKVWQQLEQRLETSPAQ